MLCWFCLGCFVCLGCRSVSVVVVWVGLVVYGCVFCVYIGGLWRFVEVCGGLYIWDLYMGDLYMWDLYIWDLYIWDFVYMRFCIYEILYIWDFIYMGSL